jgi:hypothetical protein
MTTAAMSAVINAYSGALAPVSLRDLLILVLTPDPF